MPSYTLWILSPCNTQYLKSWGRICSLPKGIKKVQESLLFIWNTIFITGNNWKEIYSDRWVENLFWEDAYMGFHFERNDFFQFAFEQSLITFYIKYTEMKLNASIISLRSFWQEWNFNPGDKILVHVMETWNRNEIIQKETFVHANIKETYYSNCCCGIQNAIKCALQQRNRICIYQCFQLKLAT